MNPTLRRSLAQTASFFEILEPRQLLSFTAPHAAATLISPSPAPVTTASSVILSGTSIYALAGQPSRAVIGTIRGLSLPAGYTLGGAIDWGDNTPLSQARFVRQTDGTLAVVGQHTYVSAGSDNISVLIVANPPPGTALPVRLIGTIHSTAKVLVPDGGVTLNETAGANFTANVGTFRSSLSSNTMIAVIDWGDGTQSRGKIVALPTDDPAGGEFAVYGNHTYSNTASYLVHVTVYSQQLSPDVDPTATPPIILVAQIDSVIDVLPPLPTAGT